MSESWIATSHLTAQPFIRCVLKQISLESLNIFCTLSDMQAPIASDKLEGADGAEAADQTANVEATGVCFDGSLLSIASCSALSSTHAGMPC